MVWWSLVRLSRFPCRQPRSSCTVSEKNGIGRLSKKKRKKMKEKIIIYDKGEAIDDIIDDAERGDLDLWSYVTSTAKAVSDSYFHCCPHTWIYTDVYTSHPSFPYMRASYYAIRETGIRKFSKGAKRPKVYRYRTWQDTVARHTLSSFELVRVPTTLMYFLAYLKNILRVCSIPVYFSAKIWKRGNEDCSPLQFAYFSSEIVTISLNND